MVDSFHEIIMHCIGYFGDSLFPIFGREDIAARNKAIRAWFCCYFWCLFVDSSVDLNVDVG